MASFLELTNRVLDRFNEPRLTVSSFPSATGFRQHAKQCVNDAVDQINNQQWEWPFNHFYSVETCIPGSQLYPLPVTTKTVDWDTFHITGFDRSAHLDLIKYEDWTRRRRSMDEVSNPDDWDLPRWVFRTQGLEIGISPKPDKEYTIAYERWIVPQMLVNATDLPTIPALYDSVIINGAMKYAYLFRENFEASSLMDKDFKDGIKSMRQVLVRTPEFITDTRR